MLLGEAASEQQGKYAIRDGHAPEVVPADGDSRASKAKPARSAMKKSKSHGKLKAASKKAESTTTEQASGQAEGTAGSSHRKSASPVFLSPTESLNSNSSTGFSSGRSNSLGHQCRESDSFADAAAAALAASSQSVKPVSSDVTSKKEESASTKLSSAALKSLDGARGSKASKASSRASAKSHSRCSSVAEWQDVELQSEAEDEAHRDKAAAIPHQSGPLSAKGRAAGTVAVAASDSDNDSELGIVEGEQHEQHVSVSSSMTARGELLLLRMLVNPVAMPHSDSQRCTACPFLSSKALVDQFSDTAAIPTQQHHQYLIYSLYNTPTHSDPACIAITCDS